MGARINAVLSRDNVRLRRLGLIASLRLPDYWVGAGFVRNAVWEHPHGRSPQPNKPTSAGSPRMTPYFLDQPAGLP
jgi:hypothetical protein